MTVLCRKYPSFIEAAQIAGPQPAVMEGGSRCFRVVPITGCNRRATNPDLALNARGQAQPRRIKDSDFRASHRTNGAGLALSWRQWIAGCRADLGESVAFDHGRVQRTLQRSNQIGRQRRADGSYETQLARQGTTPTIEKSQDRTMHGRARGVPGGAVFPSKTFITGAPDGSAGPQEGRDLRGVDHRRLPNISQRIRTKRRSPPMPPPTRGPP